MGLPIILGLGAAYLWPYAALEIGRFTVAILMVLMFFSTLLTRSSLRSVMTHLRAGDLWIGVFFCFAIVPATTWLLTNFTFHVDTLAYGFFWAALCPAALVAPQFVRARGGDVDFCFSLVIVSSLLTPLLAPLLGILFFPGQMRLQAWPLFLDLVLTVALPALLGLGTRPFVRRGEVTLRRYLPWVNMALIGALAYAFLGAAILRLNLSTLGAKDWLPLVALALGFDFLSYFALLAMLRPLIRDPARLCALRVSLSMKNVAISGTVLLFSLPLAALASSFVFAGHALFFSFLAWRPDRGEAPFR
jgi:predicted Na+-dependent transporter